MPSNPSYRDFTIVKSLTAGQNGGMNAGVFIVKSICSGTRYIEKRIPMRDVMNGTFATEARAMQRCNTHPNIVRLKFADATHALKLGYGSIYMQQCELGSLDMLISRFRRRGETLADEGFLWKVFWELSLAACFLYTGNEVESVRRASLKGDYLPRVPGWDRIIHRDIKPANVFLTWSNSGSGKNADPYPTVLLADFGMVATERDIGAGRVADGCTPCFAPPEYPRLHETADTYTLGLVIHCLARMSNDPEESRSRRERDPLGGYFPDKGLITEVGHCLLLDPSQRTASAKLPKYVFRAYKKWRVTRKNGGKRLPCWAFE